MSKSIISRKLYQLSGAIFLFFSISILGGEFSPVRAQANQSEQFFDRGREEFERQAETLGETENSLPEPQLTIEDDSSTRIEESPSPNEELELDQNLPDQPDNEQIKIKF